MFTSSRHLHAEDQSSLAFDGIQQPPLSSSRFPAFMMGKGLMETKSWRWMLSAETMASALPTKANPKPNRLPSLPLQMYTCHTSGPSSSSPTVAESYCWNPRSCLFVNTKPALDSRGKQETKGGRIPGSLTLMGVGGWCSIFSVSLPM